MGRCRTYICKSACCYNIPFESNELVKYAAKIVNKVLFTLPLGSAVVPFTNEDPNANKCPFLKADYKCNIYEDRPPVCRKFGEIEDLPCKYLKK